MKRLIVPFLAMVTLLYSSGCSEKFDVAAPYKNYTVVYAFLDNADTAHYIRIQKAFLDQDKNALTMAQEADSNFYANLDVRLKKIGFTGIINDIIPLTRVDLNAEGYPKPAGVFFNTPNYAYKYKGVLESQFIYRLVIKNLATGAVDSAEAPIIDGTSPTRFIIDQFDTTSLQFMDFASTVPTRYYAVTGVYSPPGGFDFHGQNNPAAVAQVIVRFNWDDSDIVTHVHTPQYFDFNAGTVKVNSGSINFEIRNTSLYGGLNSGLGVAPANKVRLLSRVNLFVYLGTQDYLDYQQASLIAGTGLTGNEIQPITTNIKGENVLGLFTSRGMRSGTVTLSKPTVDSLKVSPILQAAKIVGTVY